MHGSLRRTSLASTLLALAACSDDGGVVTDGSPTTSESATTQTSDTMVTGGMTGGLTSSTGVASNSTSEELTSTGPVTASSSGATQGCECSPGEGGGCQNGQQLVCGADCQGFAEQPCPGKQACEGEACQDISCTPGTTACAGEEAYKQCSAEGDAFDAPVNCGATEGCAGGACVSLCLLAEAQPSSIGCSFFAQRMDNGENESNDSLIVGNTSKTKTVQAQLYFTANGSNVEAAQGAPTAITPGKTTTYTLTNAPFNKVSGLRKGGTYRVQTDVPVVAYQHSPIGAQATNDASMLLPEHALKNDYVVASYRDGLGSYPSYFNVIAAVDGTTVSWTPPQSTVAGAGVPAVAANATGQVVMNRFDSMEVRVGNSGDISGTIISSDRPIWVIGAVNCVNVPNNVTYCDHIEEQMLPLDYWGKKYVGAHSPRRGNEKHYWRVYGGEAGTTITTTPAQPGTPFTLGKGEWKELVIANNTSFIFESDKPFLPVQYLEGENGGAGTGDPAMYQMIPVEQFLERYAFATGTGYSVHYAQIIRLAGNPDVKIDGAVVGGYYAVGGYEVADYKIGEGAHLAESEAPFGIINVGYTGVTSYAYPGGLKLAVINPQ